MLAERYDYVIGGDPDRDTVGLAVVHAATGGGREHVTKRADRRGYHRLLTWARQQAPGRRVWALEGIGSFATGLVAVLADAGEVPGARRARGAKSDRLDAVQAARTVLAQEQQAALRARGLREALRQILVTRRAVLVSRKAVNELTSLLVVAPEHLRGRLRGLALVSQLERIKALTSPADASVEHGSPC